MGSADIRLIHFAASRKLSIDLSASAGLRWEIPVLERIPVDLSNGTKFQEDEKNERF